MPNPTGLRFANAVFFLPGLAGLESTALASGAAGAAAGISTATSAMALNAHGNEAAGASRTGLPVAEFNGCAVVTPLPGVHARRSRVNEPSGGAAPFQPAQRINTAAGASVDTRAAPITADDTHRKAMDQSTGCDRLEERRARR